MQNEFLSQVAEIFLVNHEDDLKDFCFVFPNRRSSLFFQKYLGLHSSKPILAPHITTINSLFSELSNLYLEDRIALLYSLYQSYYKYLPEEKDSFDNFLLWGDILLDDFEDIDKYLVDPQKIFTNIKDLRNLDQGYEFLSEEQKNAIREFWGNFIPYSKGEKEVRFVNIWDKLYDIYSDFKERLLVTQKCYEGLIYRQVTESLREGEGVLKKLSKYKKIIFVGLNALNSCEEELLTYLDKRGIADFYWDYYGSIIKDPSNKSSFFMETNLKKFKSKYNITDDREFDKKIRVVGIPSNVGQTKYVSKILEDIIDSSSSLDLFSTAIVLPDEKLLLPVLNSIPSQIEKINVTMGYTLANSNIATFMKMISNIHMKMKDGEFYYSSVLDVLDHPFMKEVVGREEIRAKIVSQNQIFVKPGMFLEGILKTIFTPIGESNDIINAYAEYQIDIIHEIQPDLDLVEREFAYYYITTINKIKNLDLPIEPTTYFRLLDQSVSTVSIPFKGEPLSGLQIMGTLETRVLDFENLIILSVNEDVYPSKSISSSYIPPNLRKGFGLPNYEYKDSISSYHFYRSLYRAKNIWLIYDTRTDGAGVSGEVSRYVKQLKYHHGVSLEETIYNQKTISSEKSEIIINKTGEMLEKLLQNNFSASSINTYISCSLKFYYQKVENLKEVDEVLEEVDASVFGNIFHYVMEMIYKPYVGMEIRKDEIDLILQDGRIDQYIRDAFRQKIGIEEIKGKNKIEEAIVKHYVEKVLRRDEEMIPFTFVASEKWEKFKKEVQVSNVSRKISMLGAIDRIDSKNGVTRVIDYKTGKVHLEFKEVEDLFDPKKKSGIGFQLMFYLLLMKKAMGDITNVEVGVYSLQDMFKNTEIRMGSSNEDLEKFENLLGDKLNEIFDISIPFVETDDEKTCGYCPYKVLCNKTHLEC